MRQSNRSLMFHGFCRVSAGFCLAVVGLGIASAQAGSTPPAPPPPASAPATAPAPTAQAPANPNAPETTTRDEPATFRTRVNLVSVPVVVRDRNGHAVGGLHLEDFLLSDRGKAQVITKFSVERTGGRGGKGDAPGAKPNSVSDQPLPADVPEHFIAYLFDDIHAEFADLVRTRDAAGRHLDTLGTNDRAAIYTTSGQTQLEFTDDRDKLHEKLMALRPRPITRGPRSMDCPDVPYYMGEMITNRNDQQALATATAEAMICGNLDQSQTAAARAMAESAARRAVDLGGQETRVALSVLRDVVRHMAAMPGQRTIVLASPGFLTIEETQEKTDLMDRAIRSNVIISSIDARGLYTDPEFDASKPGGYSVNIQRVKGQYERDAARADADVLAELALGTGGTFVQNTNDLDGGFKRVAESPDYYYILGFSPQNLKLDGSFHGLKVTLKEPGGLTLQARRGYYAPKHLSDAVETAKQEIEEALFSREEMHDLPVDLHTQFFKASDDKARVTVLMHVDLKHLRLRKAEGRNRNDLTIVSALFDRNGNYVVGSQKLLEMRLKDETLEKRAEAGFSVRTTFDVKPGTYLVRLVVRDAEGQLMSAANGAVEIP